MNRRALLGGALLPFLRPREKGHRVTQPWSNQSVSLIEILATPGAFTGLFVFSAGRLIASVAPGGTEPSTNTPYNPGIETFDSLGRTLTMADNALTWSKLTDTPDIPPDINGFPSKASGNSIGLTTGEGNTANNPAALTLFDSAAAVGNIGAVSGQGLIFVAQSCIIATDSWHSLGSPSATGYSSDKGRYRFTPEGEVEFDIQLSTAGVAGTAGTYAYANTLPSAYRPANIRVYPIGRTDTIGSGSNFPVLIIHASGQVQIQLPGVAANNQAGGQAFMPLD